MGKGFFVTGTGNGVGKTYVAGLLAKKLNINGLKTGYYKVAGREEELEHIKKVSGIMQAAEEMCPYVYKSKNAAYQALRSAKNDVELEVVKTSLGALIDEYDCVVVEGNGGIACPIKTGSKAVWNEDVIKAMDFSCVIVSDATEGAISDVITTCEYMKSHDIPVKGVIYNNCHLGSMAEDDIMFTIEQKTGLRTIAKVVAEAQEIDIEISEVSVLFR